MKNAIIETIIILAIFGVAILGGYYFGVEATFKGF